MSTRDAQSAWLACRLVRAHFHAGVPLPPIVFLHLPPSILSTWDAGYAWARKGPLELYFARRRFVRLVVWRMCRAASSNR